MTYVVPLLCHHIVHAPGSVAVVVQSPLDAVGPGVVQRSLTVSVSQVSISVSVLEQQLHDATVTSSAGDHERSGATRSVP